ncbi:MAG TPA: glycogen synthase GlgA [Anaerolineae bacterium]|nr:glycogen synthase GlgA [Anaerolineae bacterium]HQH39747.1 glycogen synthase GlgA [Anaerolineae bacterium]
MKIMMIAAECAPFAKTGGLADVVEALPIALHALGHEVSVVMPKYGSIDVHQHPITPFFDQMDVWMGNAEEWCAVRTTSMHGVPVYFIEADKYFARPGLYHDADFHDYGDNPRRFAFLTRAGLQLAHDAGFDADIVHVHDWHTALAAAYLKVWHWNDAVLGKTASVLTIHNIGYQGVYGAEHYDYIGLQWSNFTADKLEDHGQINFLKGGIQYADLVTTVSPTYADETRTPEYAHGLAPYLNDKGANYIGILNGVDYTQWNPATDRLIPATFSADDLSGKAVCKRELQKRFMLNVDPAVPIVGVVSRFAEQKGLDLLAAAVEAIVNTMQVQVVVLGAGDKGLEAFYGGLPARYPGRIGSYIGYDNTLAHWIEAGADFFIMPSRYEPCGLNQIYSLKYGTLPIVRHTGGLADTVEPYDEATGDGTGFTFWEPSAHAVYYAVGWAVSTYYDRKPHMARMIQKAMAQNFSWEESARAYVDAYERAIKNKQAG